MNNCLNYIETIILIYFGYLLRKHCKNPQNKTWTWNKKASRFRRGRGRARQSLDILSIFGNIGNFYPASLSFIPLLFHRTSHWVHKGHGHRWRLRSRWQELKERPETWRVAIAEGVGLVMVSDHHDHDKVVFSLCRAWVYIWQHLLWSMV